MILKRKRLLLSGVDIFLTCRLSKALTFREFATVKFEPWPLPMFYLELHSACGEKLQKNILKSTSVCVFNPK